MVANIFIKALQGMNNCTMRDVIINIDQNSKFYFGHRSVLSSDEMVNDDAVTSGDELMQRSYCANYR
jgi:hypothetical protein